MKRTADTMLSGTPEAESAKRIKEGDGKLENPCTHASLKLNVSCLRPSNLAMPSPGNIRSRIPPSLSCTNTDGNLQPDSTERGPIEEDENLDAEEARRFERAWTVDSEVWADILRSDSESDVEDVKPVIRRTSTEKQKARCGEGNEVRTEINATGGVEQLESEHEQQGVIQKPTRNGILLPRSLPKSDTTAQFREEVRGLHRAKVAINVIRRQLTRVHVGSQLFLRLGESHPELELLIQLALKVCSL